LTDALAITVGWQCHHQARSPADVYSSSYHVCIYGVELVFKSPVWSGLLPFLGATGTATGCMRTDSRRNRTGTTPDWLQLQLRHKKTSRNWLRPVFLQSVATG